MERIWANRLEVFDQTWDSVPEERKVNVKKILQQDVKDNIITMEIYKSILKEDF